jgi:hypothetical protein
MPSAAECRQHAAECLRLAKEAKTDSDRDTLLKMAEEWAYAATLSDTPAKPPLPPSDSEALAGPANAKSPSHVAQQQQQPQPDPEKEEE